jgi:hypothetical protein
VAEMPMLLVLEGPGAGQRILIEQQPLIIGREETCDVVIPDRQVSRQHARITLEADRYLLEDLGSKNGTFVNGQELPGPYPLQDGDEIQIALCCRLIYVDAEATAPLVFERHPQGSYNRPCRWLSTVCWSCCIRSQTGSIAGTRSWRRCGRRMNEREFLSRPSMRWPAVYVSGWPNWILTLSTSSRSADTAFG